MDDQKRGDDAADHAPRPGGDPKPTEKGKQDAPNYDKREDGGRGLDVGDVNSANDE